MRTEIADNFFEAGWWKKPSPFTPAGEWESGGGDVDYSARPNSKVPENLRRVPCAHEGCQRQVSVYEQLHPELKYFCLLHTDEAPDDVRFQNFQFDKDIDTGGGDSEDDEPVDTE